jgi:hypothetical protein
MSILINSILINIEIFEYNENIQKEINSINQLLINPNTNKETNLLNIEKIRNYNYKINDIKSYATVFCKNTFIYEMYKCIFTIFNVEVDLPFSLKNLEQFVINSHYQRRINGKFIDNN